MLSFKMRIILVQLVLLFLFSSNNRCFATQPNIDPIQKLIREISFELIAPSAGSSEAIYRKAQAYLAKPVSKLNLKGTYEQIFVDPEEKVRRLDAALRSSKKILWCWRGGYGSNKVLPLLHKKDYKGIECKLIVGYSDATELLNFFAQVYGWQGILGCNFKDVCLQEHSRVSRERLVQFLAGKTQVLTITPLQPLNVAAKHSTRIKGRSLGGNLTCLQDSIGTPWQLKGEGAILFLEDINVHGHNLDRILVHFKNAGVFHGVRGIIFGAFPNEDLKVLRAFAESLDVPVYQTDRFGHGAHNDPVGILFFAVLTKEPSGEFVIRMTRTPPKSSMTSGR